jgi:hypothetical protein
MKMKSVPITTINKSLSQKGAKTVSSVGGEGEPDLVPENIKESLQTLSPNKDLKRTTPFTGSKQSPSFCKIFGLTRVWHLFMYTT